MCLWVAVQRRWEKALVPVQEHGSAVPSLAVGVTNQGDVPCGRWDTGSTVKHLLSSPQLKLGGDKQRA